MLNTDLLAIAIQVNQTTMLISAPGEGKTVIVGDIVKEIAEKLHGGVDHFPFVSASLPQQAPEEYGGAQVPNHATKMMDPYAMGSLLPIIQAKKGVFLGDEFGSAEGVRAAFLTFSQSKRAGNCHIPGCVVVCCMNPPESGTSVVDLSPADSNRYFFLDWELDPGAWDDYMLGGRGALVGWPTVPQTWEKTHLPKARALIVSFRKKNPMLFKVVPKEGLANGPWPSARSWEAAAKMLAAVQSCGYDIMSDHVYHAIAGCVGKTAGESFVSWLRLMNLPDPEIFLSHPQDTMQHMPERHDNIIATLEAVASAAIEDRQDKAKRWETAWEVLDFVYKTGKHDRIMSAATILCMPGRKPSGSNFPALAAKILAERKVMGISDKGIGG